MNRRALRNGLLLSLPAWGLVVLAVIFWRYLLLGVFVVFAWKALSHRLHGRRTPTFAKNVQALAVAYAAFQTRKLGGGQRRTGLSARPSPGMKRARS